MSTKFRLRLFPKVFRVGKNQKKFPRILMKSILFDAEFDAEEGYMVVFDLFCFHPDPNCNFWEKGEIP
jgi:hypothetical protein